MKYLANPRIYLIIILIGYIFHVFHFNFMADDAFISFRYAKNFINGHGLVWNIGEQPPVEGYTNFLWVIVISFFLKLGFEPVIISKILGLFFALSSTVLVYCISELIFKRKSFLNLIAPAILACCGTFAAWSNGGLETQMFTFLILAGATAYLYELQYHKKFPLSALLFILASLTRPEGIVVFGITALHRFSHSLLSKKRLFCHTTTLWLCTFLTISGIYFCWRFNYYGFLFPNTFYAKTGGGLYQLKNGYLYLRNFITITKWPILLCVSIVPLFKPSRSPLVFLSMLTLSYAVYIVSVGGDFMGMFRFFVPIVPPMAILVQEGIISLCQSLWALRWPTPVKTSVIALFSLLFILIVAGGITPSFKGYQYDRTLFHESLVKRNTIIGKWLHQIALPNETVAAIAVGAISYYSELTTIDRLGITDTHIAHKKMPYMGKGFTGHEKGDFSYVLSRKPTYFFGPLIFPKNSYYRPTPDEIRKFNQLYRPFQVRIEEANLEFYIYKLREEK
jgi:hypothetical protein